MTGVWQYNYGHLFATSFICALSSLPNDFSPPIDNTGIVSFVCDNCAKSFASCGYDAKYVHAARIRPGFA